MTASGLLQIFIYLLAAVVSVPVAKRLGLGSVRGYLLAGAAIGPSALGLIRHDGGGAVGVPQGNGIPPTVLEHDADWGDTLREFGLTAYFLRTDAEPRAADLPPARRDLNPSTHQRPFHLRFLCVLASWREFPLRLPKKKGRAPSLIPIFKPPLPAISHPFQGKNARTACASEPPAIRLHNCMKL